MTYFLELNCFKRASPILLQFCRWIFLKYSFDSELECFSSFSRIQEKFSRDLKTSITSNLTQYEIVSKETMGFGCLQYGIKQQSDNMTLCHFCALWLRNLMTSHLRLSRNFNCASISKIVKISKKTNGRIMGMQLKLLLSPSVRGNSSPQLWFEAHLDRILTMPAHFENGEKCDGTRIWASVHTMAEQFKTVGNLTVRNSCKTLMP